MKKKKKKKRKIKWIYLFVNKYPFYFINKYINIMYTLSIIKSK